VSKFIPSTRWSQARWITFGSSRLGDGALQEDFGTIFSLSILDPFVKD